MKKLKSEYHNLEYTHTINSDELSKEESETQLEVMRTWFFQNYENPVEQCPYISKEGGYIYIWGGPYDAGEELHAEFDEIVPDEVIDELVAELEEQCYEWSGVSDHSDVDEYFIDAVGSTENPFADLCLSIDRLKELLSHQFPTHLLQNVLQMIFISAITALESYLFEFFIKEVSEDEHKLRAFVESNLEFKKRKISISDIFKQSETIKETVLEYLADQLWHNISKIKPMFRLSLNIQFPEDLSDLISAIHLRHDLVHRKGKTKDGEVITLDIGKVDDLLKLIKKFAEHIETEKSGPDF